MSSSRECSEGGSRGAWSTATLFWFMIFSFSFGFGFLRRDAVADRLCSWQSPDSVRQTPSWVYVLDRSGKNKNNSVNTITYMFILELRLEEFYTDHTTSIILLNSHLITLYSKDKSHFANKLNFKHGWNLHYVLTTQVLKILPVVKNDLFFKAVNLPISLAFVKICVITWGSMTSLALVITAATKKWNKKKNNNLKHWLQQIKTTWSRFQLEKDDPQTFSGLESPTHGAVEAIFRSFFHIFLWVETLARCMEPSEDKKRPILPLL